MPAPRSAFIVVTVANSLQRRGAEKLLSAPAAKSRLPERFAQARLLVIEDPRGRRIGSGGSTLLVLDHLAGILRRERPRARALEDLFEDVDAIILHSGGDSRRLPAYSALGKAFMPLPITADAGHHWKPGDGPGPDGGLLTMFDLVLRDLATLPALPRGQVTIASGDTLVGVAGGRIRPRTRGVTGIAAAQPISAAMRHGVFVPGPAGRVRDFLQKPTRAQLLEHGAMRRGGRALVDMGIFVVAPDASARLLRAAGWRSTTSPADAASLAARLRGGACPAIDLYQHLASALARSRTPPAHPEQALLDRALRGAPFFVEVLEDAHFLHMGTTRELLSRLHDRATRRRIGFAAPAPRGAGVSYASALAAPVRSAGRVVIEGCELASAPRLGGDNLLTGVPRGAPPIHLPRGHCLAMIELRGGASGNNWSAIAYHVDDDFKTPLDRGGTIGGRPLAEVARRCGLSEGELFASQAAGAAHRADAGRPASNSERSAWTARLWPVASPARALHLVQWLIRGGAAPPAWRRARRISLAEVVRRADANALADRILGASRRQSLATMTARIEAEPWMPIERASLAAATAAEKKALAADLIGQAERPGRAPLAAARMLLAAGEALRRPASPLRSRAMERVGAVVSSHVIWPAPPRRFAALPDQAVWCSAPVRIDLAGGWSDTPPICTELGGTVLNVAIRLNGIDPVQAVAKVIERPVISIHSVDLGATVHLTRTEDLHDHRDPHDWAALPKAALVLSGLVPRDPRANLATHLRSRGGGILISMFSAVPKGSGLGTSSILGAAVLAALDRVAGRTLDRAALLEQTSVLEQLISTRGGWQDQVGGIWGGIKISRTQPGQRQRPAVETLTPSIATLDELAARTVLLYTGLRRMARNILEAVVGRYLARTHLADGVSVVTCVARLRENAEAMRAHLRQGDVDAFAASLACYWSQKCALDPASTTPAIEAMVDPVRRHLAAWQLAGAGGGGFICMVARSAAAGERIRAWYERHPPSPLSRLFAFDIAPAGLRVGVLSKVKAPDPARTPQDPATIPSRSCKKAATAI